MTIKDQTVILEAARKRESKMVAFLRDMIALPSPSGKEEAVVRRIEQEMLGGGFDEVKIDALGNILGRVGDGPRVMAFDAHIDTVDVNDPGRWGCDPFVGKVEGGMIEFSVKTDAEYRTVDELADMVLAENGGAA